jgi:Flp pilus assembly protein TadD
LVSYFEAGKICDYIAERWGDAANLGMIHSYAQRKSTADAIQDNLHESPEAFDKDFAAWLDHKTDETVQHFDDWKRGLKKAYADLQNGKKQDAQREATAVHGFYRDYVGADSDYELTANMMIATGDKAGAINVLESYREVGGTNVETLKNLAHLEIETARSKQAETTLNKLIYVYPEDAETHRMLGGLLLNSGDRSGAVREARAVIALRPTDVAQAHYELARALLAANRPKEARDEVLTALEAAPNFKLAQQLLLQLSQSE